MRPKARWAIWAAVGVAAMLASSAVVLASTGSSSSVSGFEISATSTQGRFVGSIGNGTALAGGYFYADVIHQRLQEGAPGDVTAICGTGESSATAAPRPCSDTPNPISTVTVLLPGGSSITGQFQYADSGPDHGIVFLYGRGTCPAVQKFSVADIVNFGAVFGAYEFAVILTHYSYDLFGDCITYFATISGTMTEISTG